MFLLEYFHSTNVTLFFLCLIAEIVITAKVQNEN